MVNWFNRKPKDKGQAKELKALREAAAKQAAQSRAELRAAMEELTAARKKIERNNNA